MRITWIGHSCFKIEKDGYSLVLDPYSAGSVPGLDPVGASADEVLCSHEHGDHNGRGEVSMIRAEESKSPFEITEIETYHDEVSGAKRGRNKILLISDGTHRIAHFGDLGCELTGEQNAQLQDLDLALIPVGGFYTIDGDQAAEVVQELQPRHVIPMHFRDEKAGFGYPEISTVDVFLKHMKSVLTIQRCEVDLEKVPEEQVLVLKPLRSK